MPADRARWAGGRTSARVCRSSRRGAEADDNVGIAPEHRDARQPPADAWLVGVVATRQVDGDAAYSKVAAQKEQGRSSLALLCAACPSGLTLLARRCAARQTWAPMGVGGWAPYDRVDHTEEGTWSRRRDASASWCPSS